MATVNVNINHTVIEKKILSQLEEVNDPRTMIAIYNTLAKRCDPYVPFLEGPLSQSAQVSAQGVRYIQPYARYQYYGTGFNHTTEYHPLASAMWDKAMLRDNREEFTKEVKDIIVWRMKQHVSGR